MHDFIRVGFQSSCVCLSIGEEDVDMNARAQLLGQLPSLDRLDVIVLAASAGDVSTMMQILEKHPEEVCSSIRQWFYSEHSRLFIYRQFCLDGFALHTHNYKSWCTYYNIICLFIWAIWLGGLVTLPFFSFSFLVCYAQLFPCMHHTQLI